MRGCVTLLLLSLFSHYTHLFMPCTCMHFTVPISITPSGMNTAGEQYQLACTFISTMATPSVTWTGPPNGGPLPSGNSDTRMVSDVMSSGSTHTSILQFEPLQTSHEGNYICQATVGTLTEMASFQVNVETPVFMTDDTNTERAGGSDSSTGPGSTINYGGGSIIRAVIILGVIVGLLVVVILPVMVAVIVIVCIFRRHHSARDKSVTI